MFAQNRNSKVVKDLLYVSPYIFVCLSSRWTSEVYSRQRESGGLTTLGAIFWYRTVSSSKRSSETTKKYPCRHIWPGITLRRPYVAYLVNNRVWSRLCCDSRSAFTFPAAAAAAAAHCTRARAYLIELDSGAKISGSISWQQLLGWLKHNLGSTARNGWRKEVGILWNIFPCWVG